MKHSRAVFAVLVAATLLCVVHSPSFAEERFGPWVYYAPYYFPQNLASLGHGLLPMNFAPRYESPNPAQPPNAVPPCDSPASTGPVKVSNRTPHAGQRASLGGPSGGAENSPSRRSLERPERSLRQPASSERTGSPASGQPAGERSHSSDSSALRSNPPQSVGSQPRSSAAPIFRYDSGELPSAQVQTQKPAPPYKPEQSPVAGPAQPTSRVNAVERMETPYESPRFPAAQEGAGLPPAAQYTGSETPVAGGPGAQSPSSGQVPPKRNWTWGQQSRQPTERPRMINPPLP
jgi:hypothetical protein